MLPLIFINNIKINNMKTKQKTMKNIHLIPTDKPSRLIFNSFHKSFCYQKEIDGMFINDGKVSGASFWSIEKAENNGFCPQNIYITSDEEIKEGDWFAVELFKITGESKGLHIEKCIKLNDIWCNDFDVVSTRHKGNCNKIILTTDQDLIKDGVQAIDDEFLQWFVKNPSCEEVEIESKEYYYDKEYWYTHYKIIIPKEEPITLGKIVPKERVIGLEELKQETLEDLIYQTIGLAANQQGIINQALATSNVMKVLQERMYSDMQEYAEFCIECDRANLKPIIAKDWFEQFKKK